MARLVKPRPHDWLTATQEKAYTAEPYVGTILVRTRRIYGGRKVVLVPVRIMLLRDLRVVLTFRCLPSSV